MLAKQFTQIYLFPKQLSKISRNLLRRRSPFANELQALDFVVDQTKILLVFMEFNNKCPNGFK